MQVPEGIANPMGYVCRLIKSLYGLRHASRMWFSKMSTELIAQGFFQSKSDSCLFIHKHGIDITIIVVCVDDIIITGNNDSHTIFIKSHLDKVFSIKELGILHYFLGIEINYLPDGIVLSQKKFTSDLLKLCANEDLSKKGSHTSSFTS